MGRFAVSIVVFFWLWLGTPTAALGAKLDWLYDVDVPVSDQSAKQRSVAAREGLLVVLRRVTGLAEIPLSEPVREALAAPQLYYVEYRYREESPPAPDSGPTRNLFLALRFAEPAVQRLVLQAQLPLWSSNRPTIVAWIAVTEGTDRSVLGASDPSPLLVALRERARERGLALVVPLMDLDEQLEVSPAVIWGAMFDALEVASERYAADDLLVGRVTKTPAGTWSADWQLWQEGAVTRLAVESATPEEAGAAIVDRLTADQVARYAIESGNERRLQMRVENVGTASDYGGLLSYLGGLEFIGSVQVEEVTRTAVILSLDTRTQGDRLRDLFALDGRLEPADEPAAFGVVAMVWRGNVSR